MGGTITAAVNLLRLYCMHVINKSVLEIIWNFNNLNMPWYNVVSHNSSYYLKMYVTATWLSPRVLLHDSQIFQFSSVAQSCPSLCDPMNRSTPGLPVYHQILEFTQTHVHRVHEAIQPSHPQSSPSPPAPNLSQHQSLFQWVNSSHEVAKVLELQL